MTTAFLEVMASVLAASAAPHLSVAGDFTYPALLDRLHATLGARGFEQLPQISATHPFALDRRVGLADTPPPGAPLGRVVRVPRPPCPRRDFAGGLGEMLCSSDLTGFLVGTAVATGAARSKATDDSVDRLSTFGQSEHATSGGLLGGLLGGSWFGGGGGGGSARPFDAHAEDGGLAPPAPVSFAADCDGTDEDEDDGASYAESDGLMDDDYADDELDFD